MEAPVTNTTTNLTAASSMSGQQRTSQDSAQTNGIQLPKQLESVKVAQVFPLNRHRWNTNEEIASILIAFSKHVDWQYHEIKLRPPSGCMLLFNRNSVRYRKDGYCWKKRKDGKTIREDHMKLKVQGLECIYGSYVHSAILPTFHRRCYWLLQNPDTVLVHYLNVPYPNSTKLSIPIVTFAMEKKEWTKEELVDQLTPMFSSLDGERIPAIDETILTLVQRLIENRQKHNQEIKGDNSGKNYCHGKSASGGEPPINIKPEGAAFKPLHECCGGSSGINSQSNFNNAMFNQAQDLQNRIDLAQGPLILNLGAVSGGVMVVTSQTNATQLSILTKSSTSGQLQNWNNSGHVLNAQPTVSQLNTFSQTAASQNVSQNIYEQTAAHHLQQKQINCSSCTAVYHTCQSPIPSNISLQHQHQHHDVNNARGCQSNRATCAHENNAGNIENHSNISMQHIDSCGRIQSQEQNDSRLYQPMTPEPVSRDVENIDSLVDESYLELMAASKNTPSGTEPKRSFDHLGDSFDSLQASLSSLQGSDLNLDQLDLIDLPEFEKICNEISNNSSIDICNNSSMNSHNSQGGNDQRNFDTDTSANCVNLSIINTNNLSLSNQNSCSQNVMDRGEIGLNGVGNGNDPSSAKYEGQSSRLCQTQVLPSGHPSFHIRGDNLMHTTKTPSTIAMITDFSPDWSYTEGQTKVLVTGPWHSHMGTYTVLLGGKVVATTLVQPGVLRCFVPGHEADLVSLQVSCDGTVISNTVAFQYKDTPKHTQETRQTQADWFTVDACRLQQQLVVKLGHIESALSKVPDCPTIKQIIPVGSQPDTDMDTCLTRHLESLSTRLWTTNDLSLENGSMGLTLLHLAAGLGYQRVIKTLINWRNENSSWILEYEVDAHSTDLNSCTPLMWACARGHTEAAITLYNWNKSPLHSFNREGNLPLFIARQRGYHTLADQLEQLDSSADLLHNLASSNQSQSNESISSASIYSSQSFGNGQNIHQLLCSNLNTHMNLVSSVRSTPEKTFFSSEYPAATSTPISKDKPASTEIFKSPQLRSKSSKALGALNIDIPATTSVKDVSAQFNQQETREKLTRRQSDQMLKITSTSTSALPTSSSSLTSAERRQKLKKRLSVDILPYETSEPPVHFSPTAAFQRPVREAISEPRLSAHMEHLMCETNPMLSEGREMSSPELLMQMEDCERLESDRQGTSQDTSGQPDNMDTDNLSEGSASSFIDVERVSSDDENIEELKRKMLSSGNENEKIQMVHLAKQIIAAMPERIKSSPSRSDDSQPDEFQRERSNSHSSLQSASPHASSSYGEALSSYGEDSGISTPMRDSLAFDEYRYADVYSDLGTPASSLSPDSTCLHSPYSPYSFQLDSPPPTAADFLEYFNAPATYMEKDFSQLTLSDMEQRKLYEAAKVIQSAYRQYRDKQCKQQNKEIEAAVLIQSYYRRYKQYAYYKKMTQAAVLIQSQFRSYYAQKRFKKSRDAAVVIQNQYRSYKEHERLKKGGSKSVIQRYRSHYQRKPAGAEAGKGARVVQIVPDTGDGSQPEQTNTVIEDCPQDTNSEIVPPGEEGIENQGQVTLTDGTQGE